MKVDRHALPEPQSADRRLGLSAELRPPETRSEVQLAEIWQSLLSLDAVGLDDNFFELGGHSMLAVELILQIETKLGVSLDGMDILRESLEVLGSLCDRALGRPAKQPYAAPVADARERFESCYFGLNQSLYGVFFPARTREPQIAALICAPLGAEIVRGHFVLRKLARQLSAAGVPSLRFDYFGTGDSLGEHIEATCQRWQQDIAAAYAELRRRSGAPRIVAIGVRLGATLLCNVAHSLELSRIVVWDPVLSGRDYYSNLVRLHGEHLRGVRDLRPLGGRSKVTDGEDLLGFAFSNTSLAELKALSMTTTPSMLRNVSWMETTGRAAPTGVGHFEAMEFNCGWEELTDLEDILPDVGFSKMLADMVHDS